MNEEKQKESELVAKCYSCNLSDENGVEPGILVRQHITYYDPRNHESTRMKILKTRHECSFGRENCSTLKIYDRLFSSITETVEVKNE